MVWRTKISFSYVARSGAEKIIKNLKYAVADARRCKDSEEFGQAVILLGNCAGTVNSEYTRILTAYRHIAAEFRIHIQASIKNTDLTNSMRQLGKKI